MKKYDKGCINKRNNKERLMVLCFSCKTKGEKNRLQNKADKHFMGNNHNCSNRADSRPHDGKKSKLFLYLQKKFWI